MPATATETGLEAQSPWTCRSPRTFVAVAGAERSAPLTVSSPPCSERLHIAATRRVALGGNLRVTVIDRWEQGGFPVDVCARPPHRRPRCRRIDAPPGHVVRHALFRASRVGDWRVTVRDPWHAVALPRVAVRRQRRSGKPLVLFTGDSMMLAPERVLRRRLGGRARTVEDLYVGSGLAGSFIADWSRLPRAQIRAYHPDATVLALGMNDTGDLITDDGAAIHCCGTDYRAAYARRARTVMRAYLRGGRGAVVWLNVPLARDPRRWPAENTVNAAVAEAALGLERVRIVDQAAMLTPDGYQETGTLGGRTMRLRSDDGIHVTAAASRYVSQFVLTALGPRFGVVAGFRASPVAAAP